MFNPIVQKCPPNELKMQISSPGNCCSSKQNSCLGNILGGNNRKEAKGFNFKAVWKFNVWRQLICLGKPIEASWKKATTRTVREMMETFQPFALYFNGKASKNLRKQTGETRWNVSWKIHRRQYCGCISKVLLSGRCVSRWEQEVTNIFWEKGKHWKGENPKGISPCRHDEQKILQNCNGVSQCSIEG